MRLFFATIVFSFTFLSFSFAHAQQKPFPLYQPQAGDIILFQTPRPLKRAGTHLITGAPITHSAIIIEDTDRELKLLYAIGPKHKKHKKGAADEYEETGVIIEPLYTALINEPDTLFVRTLKNPLTRKESRQLTAFAHREAGKPFFEDDLAIVTTRPQRKNPPPTTYDTYFCSKLVSAACVAAGILGKDRYGNYVNPPGVTPADLATNRRINLSFRWHRPVPLYISE